MALDAWEYVGYETPEKSEADGTPKHLGYKLSKVLEQVEHEARSTQEYEMREAREACKHVAHTAREAIELIRHNSRQTREHVR